jgi:hypothetical protein
MSTYTLEQLADPQTYINDSELATFTRKICAKTHVDGSMPFGDWKREYLAGKHAEHVLSALNEANETARAAQLAADKALFAKTAKIEAALAKLGKQIPAGITLDVTETGLVLKATWDGGDLAERLSRVDARWNREQKHFYIPLDAVPSLGRILINWRKAQDEREAAESEQKRQVAIKRQQAESARQTEWARQREQDAAARKTQQERQAKAIAQRRQVVVGQYKVGDVLDGKPITGFGKSWEEGTLKFGQLWQECDYGRCENEPVCVRCFKCAKHCGCDTETYCYAYFD